MRRPCIVNGCPNLSSAGSRCRAHELPAYPHAERQRMASAVLLHLERYGPWCPGYAVPPHQATDLTADHVTPRRNGGLGGPLSVLCRACNGRKAAR